MTEEEFKNTKQWKQLSAENVKVGNAEVISLFPTPLYVQHDAVTDEDVKSLKEVVVTPEHDFTANFGVQSENNYVLDLPEYKQLRDKLAYFVNDFANNVLCFAGEFDITQSWVSIKRPYQMHTPHIHANSIISGVLYFDNIEGAEGIVFHKNIDPSDYVMRPALSTFVDTVYKHTETQLTVENHMLVMFPSYLKHGVMLNQSQVNRYSLAFNAMPKHQLGLQRDLTQLVMPEKFTQPIL